MRRFRRFLIAKSNNIKIVNKLIVFNLFLCILPIIAISLVLNSQIETSIRAEQSRAYENDINNYLSALNVELTEYINMASRIAGDGQVVDFLYTLGQLAPDDYYRRAAAMQNVINAQLEQKKDSVCKDANLFISAALPAAYATRVSTARVAEAEGWYADYLAMQPGEDGFFFVTSQPEGNYYSIIKNVYSADGPYGESLGFVKLDLLLERLCYHPAWSGGQPGMTLLITSADNREVYYAKGQSAFQIRAAEAARLTEGTSGAVFIDHNRLLFHKEVARTGWNAYFLIDDSLALNKISEVRSLVILLGAALFTLAVLLSMVFSRIFSGRINRLISKMDRVKGGNFDILASDVIDGDDEVATIDRNFNYMVKMLKKLIDDNYVQKLSTREAELNALKFQINPHFLFNTLETINAMSTELGVNQIGVISQKLGEMFRYSLNVSPGELELLKNELRHVRNYVDIQKIRFDDMFDVVYEVPEEFMTCRVMRFILQPIVENAIKYGAEQSGEACVIRLAARREGEALLIEVSDNGPGIAPEEVERLNRMFCEDAPEPFVNRGGHGIGMKNVNARIRLACGADYGLRVDSTPGQGAHIRIRVPYYNER